MLIIIGFGFLPEAFCKYIHYFYLSTENHDFLSLRMLFRLSPLQSRQFVAVSARQCLRKFKLRKQGLTRFKSADIMSSRLYPGTLIAI